MVGTPCEDSAAIGVQLGRILESQGFQQGKLAARFLSFVVDETLAGRSHELKAHTIAVGALGRSRRFDPKSDTAVRVEAIRLRSKLEQYYATDGKHDSILIEIPKGQYVPQFSYRTPDVQVLSESPAADVGAVRSRAVVPAILGVARRHVVWLLIGCALLAVVALISVFRDAPVVRPSSPSELQIVRHHTAIDLSGWKEVDELHRKDEVWSDRTVTTLIMRRRTESARYFTHVIGTVADGPEPSFQCLSRQKCGKDRNTVGVMENYKSWLVWVDLSNEPVGQDFEVRYEERFWNGFPGISREWTAVLASYPTSKLTIDISFPASKPARNCVYTYSVDSAGAPRETYQVPAGETVQSCDQPVTRLTWDIPSPSTGRFYRVDWEW